jgi:hypothetical protein
MVCWDRIATYQTKLDMKNVDINALARAVKMLDNVKSVKVTGNTIEVTMMEGSTPVTCKLTVTQQEIIVDGYYGRRIQDQMKQYYVALTQYEQLKMKGFTTYMQKQGNKLIIQAKR